MEAGEEEEEKAVWRGSCGEGCGCTDFRLSAVVTSGNRSCYRTIQLWRRISEQYRCLVISDIAWCVPFHAVIRAFFV